MLCEEWDYNKNEQKPSEYTPHSHYKVWWKCKECGHEWCESIANRNRGNGCPVCKISKGEKLISQLLDMHNIFYIAQITFDDLRGIGGRLLSYDFYVPTLNLLIEYQGLQHEHYCEGFHKSKNAFKKQHEHDLRKREYAKNNDIELLEIWYWNFNNIEEILHQALNI